MLLFLLLSDKCRLLVWSWISYYLCGLSRWAGTYIALEGRRGECKTASVIFGHLVPPAFDVWSPVRAHGCNMYGLFSSHLFCYACFNVKCCQTEIRKGSRCRFETLTVNFCQTNLFGSGMMWMCLMWLPAAEVTTQMFGKPSKSLKNRNATKSLVSTKMCTRSSYDFSMVFG